MNWTVLFLSVMVRDNVTATKFVISFFRCSIMFVYILLLFLPQMFRLTVLYGFFLGFVFALQFVSVRFDLRTAVLSRFPHGLYSRFKSNAWVRKGTGSLFKFHICIVFKLSIISLNTLIYYSWLIFITWCVAFLLLE